jgi:hypothetical protein
VKRALWILAVALAACSGQQEVFHVAPGGKYVLIGSGTGAKGSLRSVEVETGAVVARFSEIDPQGPIFSRDGSRFAVRNPDSGFIVARTAGGEQARFEGAIDAGKISDDGSRVAFLRSPAPCVPASRSPSCLADLYSAPANGGEPVRIAAGLVFDVTGFAQPVLVIDQYWFASNDTLVFTSQEGPPQYVPADGSSDPALLAATKEFWILDGGHVAVRDHTGLVVLDARGGNPIRLVEGPFDRLLCNHFEVCTLSSAGALAVVMSSGALSTVRIVSLTGQAPFDIEATGSYGFDSDGDFVFTDAGDFLSRASPSAAIVRSGQFPIPGSSGFLSPDLEWTLIGSDHGDHHCTFDCCPEGSRCRSQTSSRRPIRSASCCARRIASLPSCPSAAASRDSSIPR